MYLSDKIFINEMQNKKEKGKNHIFHALCYQK